MNAPTTDWQHDAQYLADLLRQKHGAMVWERAADRRWYMAQMLTSLFYEDILELRWGGAGKAPSRILRQPIADQDIPTMAASICQRRRAHGYLPNLPKTAISPDAQG